MDDRGLLMIWNKEAKYSSAFSNGWQRTADDMKQGRQIQFCIQQRMPEDCWWYETRKPNRVLHPATDDRGLLMIWNKEAKYSSTSSNGWQRTADDMKQGSQIQFYIQQRMTEDCWWYQTRKPNRVLHPAMDVRGLVMIWNKEANYSSTSSSGWQRTADDMKQGSRTEFYIKQWMTEDRWWYETRKPNRVLHPAMDDRGLLIIWNKEAKYSSAFSNGWQRTADDMKQGRQIQFCIQQRMTEDCWWYETRKPNRVLHPATDDRGLLMIWNKEAKYSSTSSNGWQRTADDMKQGS